MSFGKCNYVMKSFELDYKTIEPNACFDKDVKGVFTDTSTLLAFKAYERAFNHAHTTACREIGYANHEKASSKLFVVARSASDGHLEFIRRPYQHHTVGAAIEDAKNKFEKHNQGFHVFACVASINHKSPKDIS